MLVAEVPLGGSVTLREHKMPYNVNTFGVAAAVVSLKDPQHIKEERARNTAVETLVRDGILKHSKLRESIAAEA